MGAMISRLKSFPLLGDLFHSRAEKKVSEKTWLDVASVAIPAILGTTFTVTDLSLKLLAPLPRSSLFLQAAMPALILSVCMYIVVSRKKAQRHSGGFPGRVESYLLYNYSEAARLFAKLALLPLAVITAYYIWGILPNGLVGRRPVAGFICRAVDGQAIKNGVVEVLDSAGEMVSTVPESLDDTGFFYSDLKWWGSRPHSLRLSSQLCSSKLVPIRDSAQLGSCCPRDKIQPTRLGQYPVWVLICD